MGLHAQIAHRALAGGEGDQVQVQHLADQVQGADADAGVALARIQDGHQHHRPGLLPVQGLAHGAGVGADDVLLKGGGVLGGDGIAHVLPKAGGHAIDDPALLQEFIQQGVVGVHRVDHLLGELQLGAELHHGDELVQGDHAVGEGDGLDLAGFFHRDVHMYSS